MGTIYENTFGQIRIRPSLGKPNIQAKEVYWLDRVLYRPKNRSERDDPDNYMPEGFSCALYKFLSAISELLQTSVSKRG